MAYSGQPFTGGTPALHWRISGGWSSAPMTALTSREYVASIPAQPFGEVVRYYVQAEDASGRNESHPYVGAANPHSFTVTHLGTDVSGVSLAQGGTVGFQLNAGAANAGRSYFMLGSASGTSPGTNLPGGLVLPLNRDAFMGYVRSSVNTPAFAGFQGSLDAAGMASAQMDLGAALPSWHGETLHLAFFCHPPFDFVSNAVSIEVLD